VKFRGVLDVIAIPLVLAALLTAADVDANGPPIVGVVIDGSDRALAGVEVVLACGRSADGSVPVLARGRTDDKGEFRLQRPPETVLARSGAIWGAAWAYGPGRAISGAKWLRFPGPPAKPMRITMGGPAKRSVTVKGADGLPRVGVAVAPASVFRDGLFYGMHLPDEVVDRLSAATGPDGKADLPGLTADMEVQALRVRDVDGTVQTRTFEAGGNGGAGDFAVTLDGPGGLVGSVAVGGEPAAGLAVELWSKAGAYLGIAPVRFVGGPLRTGADGSFQTPPTLWRGHAYRAVVRAAEGLAPRVSSWVTLDGPLGVIPPLTLEPLREVAGRITDRSGAPLAGVEVFQAGDGPTPTTTATGDDGRFRLGGYDRDHAFLFARKPGYRFGGLGVSPGKGGVELALTGQGQEPDRVMRTLPDPLPREQMVAISRRLIEPYLTRAVVAKDDGGKFRALSSLAMGDPVGAIGRGEELGLAARNLFDILRGRAALMLAADDPEEAAAALEAVAEPGTRAGFLVDLADALPADQRVRKLDLLDRAAVQARASGETRTKVFQLGEVAERLAELGATARAKALFAEGKPLAEAVAGQARSGAETFAARMARVDLPGALAVIERNTDPDALAVGLGNAAVRVAAVDPAAAEGLLRRAFEGNRVDNRTGDIAVAVVARALAKTDPGRARRVIDLAGDPAWRAHAWAFLAAGLPGSDREGRRDALRHAGAEFDRLPPGEEGDLVINPAAAILPLVEAADPAAVGEFFWRSLSMRGPSFNPLDLVGDGDGAWWALPLMLSRYDRGVAAVLFEPSLAYARDALPRGGETYASILCLTAAAVDPELAVGLIESMPAEAKADAGEPGNWSRITVAEFLGRPPAARWKAVWRQYTGVGLTIYDRDLR